MDSKSISTYESIYKLYLHGMEVNHDHTSLLHSLPNYDDEEYQRILADNIAYEQRLENAFKDLERNLPSLRETIDIMRNDTIVVLTPGGAEYLQRKKRSSRPPRPPRSSLNQKRNPTPKSTAADIIPVDPKDPYYWIECYGSIGL